MESEFTCKRLVAIYQENDLFLSGPHNLSFNIEKETTITVKIEQCGIRNITISTDNEITQLEMYTVLTRIERLLMLFEGCFIKLSELKFSDSVTYTENQLENYAQHMMNNRLSYFESSDFSKAKVNCLIEYESVITSDLYVRWEVLLDELDVVNQMYLYSLSDSRMPIDLKCAFLIELSEPLIEIVKVHKKYFTSLEPGKRGTSLKNCIDSLITKYGVDIFKIEIERNYEMILSMMVNSRNRIMHIKRKQTQKFFSGKESVLYINKMSLLYRHILFQMLDIDEDIYHDNLINCIIRWNKWNDILDKLMYKTS